MKEYYKILESIKNKNILDKNFVDNYLNKNLLINYLLQDEKTIDIAMYISEKMFDEDTYKIYLYTLSNYPKNLNIKLIKNENNINKDIELLLDILNSNNNDVLNILKIINKNLINKIRDRNELLLNNNEEFEDCVEKENYFLNIK